MVAVTKSESYFRGRTLLAQDRVFLEKETDRFWYFHVTSMSGPIHFVKIDKSTFEDNCCCPHGSQWRFQSGPNRIPRTCAHLWACRHYLANQGIAEALERNTEREA